MPLYNWNMIALKSERGTKMVKGAEKGEGDVEMKLKSLWAVGLQILQDQDQAQKSQIEADLKANKLLTQSDEEWLDGEGKLVDKEHVVQELKNASDYKWALQELNIRDQSIVERLQVLGLKEAKPCMFAIIFFSFFKAH
ncbi:hypothetical protein BGW80DRAFT_1247050 [Lactifluus volemus]|nr:hypothetical protein BGW80DRAFT_1247050 [Lactifluus volemus]